MARQCNAEHGIAKLVSSQGQRATVGPTGAARSRMESRVEHGNAAQGSAAQRLFSRSGYGVTRSHNRGGNVTSGGDGTVVDGIVRECIVENCRAALLLPQPLRTSQGPTVQEVPRGLRRKVEHGSGDHSLYLVGVGNRPCAKRGSDCMKPSTY